MTENDFNLNEDEIHNALNNDGFELNDTFLFNNKNFQTIIIETQQNKDNNTSSKKQILDTKKFIQQYKHVDEKNDLLQWLKKNNLKELLIEQIQNNQNKEELIVLISAYWEAGFDDFMDMPVFIPHLLSPDFSLALEAYSVIMNLSKPFDLHQTQHAIQTIENNYHQLSPETIVLVNEILELLKQQINHQQ